MISPLFIRLVISKRLVEGMGGTIRVQSALSVGSTFSFTLPCTRATGVQPQLHGLTTEDQQLLKSARCLIICTQGTPAAADVRILQSYGAAVSIVETIDAALTLLSPARPDPASLSSSTSSIVSASSPAPFAAIIVDLDAVHRSASEVAAALHTAVPLLLIAKLSPLSLSNVDSPIIHKLPPDMASWNSAGFAAQFPHPPSPALMPSSHGLGHFTKLVRPYRRCMFLRALLRTIRGVTSSALPDTPHTPLSLASPALPSRSIFVAAPRIPSEAAAAAATSSPSSSPHTLRAASAARSPQSRSALPNLASTHPLRILLAEVSNTPVRATARLVFARVLIVSSASLFCCARRTIPST